jgi:hypothetical protein
MLGQFFLGLKILAWYIDPKGIESKNIFKYPYPVGIKINCEPIIVDTHMISNKTILVQQWFTLKSMSKV